MAGQVWRWFNQDDHPMYWWDELWLLVRPVTPEEHDKLDLAYRRETQMWWAFNLETSEWWQLTVEDLDAEHWEFFA